MTDYQRLCGGCHRVWLTQQSDELFLCTRCYAKRWAEYDPQPFRGIVYGEKVPQIRCYVVGDWREYCVLDRDGDRLVLRLFGEPDAPKIETDLHCTSPYPVHRKIQG